MKMQKRRFRIGELANRVDVERFVIRFWEKEFNIKTDRSDGKQRFYTEDDYNMFKRIKELLYGEGFTIAGAKKHLKSKNKKPTETRITLAKKTDEHKKEIRKLERRKEELSTQIINLQKKLMKLRELL